MRGASWRCSGDRIVVDAGGVIPLDGKISEGEVMVNQASLTGEAVPVARRPGSARRSIAYQKLWDTTQNYPAKVSTFKGIPPKLPVYRHGPP